MRFALARPESMSRTAFTLEIHPRAWYALANLPKEVYERIKRGLAEVADNAAYAQDPQRSAGGFLSLDGYLARYELQPERSSVVVLDIERSAVGHCPALSAPQQTGANVMSAGAARNVLIDAVPGAPAQHSPAPDDRCCGGEAETPSPSGRGAG